MKFLLFHRQNTKINNVELSKSSQKVIINEKTFQFKFIVTVKKTEKRREEMTSQQKSAKKSTKFNYLVEDSIKQKLIGRYENLNFSPSGYKRNYQTSSPDKNKENLRQNLKRDTVIEKNIFTKNPSLNFDPVNGHLNHRLISFSKNRPDDLKADPIKQKQPTRFIQEQWNRIEQMKQAKKIQTAKRIRNKSFGNFSIKRQQLQSEYGKKSKSKLLQFSPYKEQKSYFKEVDLKSEKQKQRVRQQIDDRAYGSHQNLLIYEMEEQQQIVKKQLKQYEYQNQLLRQKISYLESDNASLKQLTEEYKDQIEAKQRLYQQQIHTQTMSIHKLEEHALTLSIQKQKFQAEVNEGKYLISDLQRELSSLALQVQDLQMVLNVKEQIITDLKTKMQKITINQQNFYPQTNKRRKSLDISVQGSKFLDHRSTEKLNMQKYSTSQLNQIIQLKNTKTSNVGKLMNKTLPYGSDQRQDAKTTEKQQNFIESIKSMYFKITSREAKDLKELWKWLKSIAHEYQSLIQLYNIKDSVLAVLQEFEARDQLGNNYQQLPSMGEECFRIIKKLSQVIAKTYP